VLNSTHRSRRAFLGLLAGGTGATVAGWLGRDDAVSVLAAGSLAVVLDEAVAREFRDDRGTPVHGEYHGTNAVMRMIREKQKHPDVVVSADVGLLRDRLYPEHATWDVLFAGNEVVLAYNPETETGARLAEKEDWTAVLRDAAPGEVVVSDPDLDPLGYRAVHMLELAAREYDRPGLPAAVLGAADVEPEEPALLAGLEAGDRAVAIVYRNMAVERGLPFRSLPATLNFSDPALADHYAAASYTTDRGYTARGSPMRYNATVLESADNPALGREFLSFLVGNPGLLRENGLVVPDRLPETNGAQPDIRLDT